MNTLPDWYRNLSPSQRTTPSHVVGVHTKEEAEAILSASLDKYSEAEALADARGGCTGDRCRGHSWRSSTCSTCRSAKEHAEKRDHRRALETERVRRKKMRAAVKALDKKMEDAPPSDTFRFTPDPHLDADSVGQEWKKMAREVQQQLVDLGAKMERVS